MRLPLSTHHHSHRKSDAITTPPSHTHHHDHSTCEDGDGSKDTCCSDKRSSHSLGDTIETKATDPERGSGQYERVVLSVQGMTCSGCEKKLVKAFRNLPSVRGLRTSLVLARAEFQIDVSVTSVEEAIQQLKRFTSYSFERVEDDIGQALDIMTDDPDCFDAASKARGVRLVECPKKNDKKLLRIYYNSSEIGARDLLETVLRKFQPKLARLQPHPSLLAGKKQMQKEGLLFAAAAILTLPVLVIAFAPIRNRKSVACQATSLALATIVQVGVAFEFYPSAFKSLFRSRVIEMDLLIVLSTTAAYAFSVVAFAFLVKKHELETGSFFETSTLLATLILLGRFISELARQKATESISIRSLQSPTAILVGRDNRTSIRVIDARLLQFGDVFRVEPHSSIVTDGVVVHGGSEVDESMVTGESVPVAKALGSHVIAGSVNGGGYLDVALTNIPGQNTISVIADMVDEAELSKPRTQAIADKIAGYFVPVIVVITLIVFMIWMLVGIYKRKKSRANSAVEALTYAIATLIISCPCAIGLAVPMVVVIAGGVAAKYGIVFKSPQTIEVARKTTHVVFDKTGTLTQGRMCVVKDFCIGFEQALTKGLLLGMVQNAKHPVSAGVADFLEEGGIRPIKLDSVAVQPGKGIEAFRNGTKIRAGNSRWLGVENNVHVQAVLQDGSTAFCVEIGGILVAIFGLKDALRPESVEVVRELTARGISVHLVSGDDEVSVKTIATELSIKHENVRSRCSPSEKRSYVQSLLDKEPKATVVFCGDGTNDAVALAQATLGFHLNSGSATEVSRSAADVVLVRPDLYGVLTAIDISKGAFRRIMFNFGWAALYNVFAILLAAGAFVNVRIKPEYAGLGEICSVLPVILIGFGMKFVKFGKHGRAELEIRGV